MANKTYTEEELLVFLKSEHCDFDLSETDNEGQIVIYTGLFRWKDGTIREEPEPQPLSPNDDQFVS